MGYKTDAEAEKAKKWFDRTFVDSSRISVTVVDVSIFFLACILVLLYLLTHLFSFSFRELRMHLLQGQINDRVSRDLNLLTNLLRLHLLKARRRLSLLSLPLPRMANLKSS